MKALELKTKKITLSTLKSFINKSSELFVEVKSSFDGMEDGVRKVADNFSKVSKEDAIGHNGVWCVGGSRNYFTFVENDNYFGIEVYNCCGSGILWTKK
jgi:hypothetical protein